jgi:phosphomannomutase
LADLANVVQKTPQVIASAYVGNGQRLDRAALDDLGKQSQASLPALRRINLRYSGTEALFRAMLEADAEVSTAELGQLAWNICRKIQTTAGISDGPIEILNCTQGGLLEPA